MADKHKKRRALLLVLREMQIKTTMGRHLIHQIGKIKSLVFSRVGWGVRNSCFYLFSVRVHGGECGSDY